jgi:carboxyl-terminal processing protease
MKYPILRKPIFTVLGLLALGLLSFGAGYWANEQTKGADQKLLDAAYRVVVNDSLFNPLSSRELSYAAIRGMLENIEDPYAELIEPQAAKNFTNTFAGQTGVVGLYAENKANQVVVAIVFPNGAADQAGIQVGDVILAIDDKTLDVDTDSSETGLMLRGSPNTPVHLKILRSGQEIEFDLVRQVRTYVSSSMLPGGIGYISLTAFNRTATEQMKGALEALMAQNPAGLVWDLRNNEGGDMLAAQDMLSFFIQDGLLFSAELTQQRKVEFRASGKTIAPDIPMVVLIDKTTYSAAETSAATISERGRGTTIGGNSYGKGVIQATVPLSDDHLLQLTIARWYSPDGEWYQGRGVSPQIEASDDPATPADELLQRGIELLVKNP